mgnify:CR=1 FL=1
MQGTYKAGTYGQRRWKEARAKKVAENKAREKVVKKAMSAKHLQRKRKEEPPKKEWASRNIGVKAMPLATEGVDPLSMDRVIGGGQMARQRVLPAPLGKGGSRDVEARKQNDRGREIQLAVNTMPLRPPQGYYEEIRAGLAQREFEQNGNFGEYEDNGDEAWGDDDAVDAMRAEAPDAEVIVDAQGNEEIQMNYGASGRAQPNQIAEMPEWADQDIPDEQSAPMMGDALDELADDLLDMDMSADVEVQELAGQLSLMDVDDDEDDEAWEATLDEIANRTPQEQVAWEKEQIMAEVARKSAIRGEKPEGTHKWSGAGVSQPGFIQGLKPSFKHPTPEPGHLYARDRRGDIKTKKGKRISEKLGFTKEDEKEIIAPQLTEEGKALYEGRIMDARPGMAGKDIIMGSRSREIPVGKDQIKYKEKMGWGDAPKRAYPMKEKSKEGDIRQIESLVRHPKTRKILRRMEEGDKEDPKDSSDKTYKKYGSGRFATGEEITEPTLYTSSGRKKPIEQAWGVAQKGMGRGEEASGFVRDPWEGRRAVGKEAGKRATYQGYHGIKASKKDTAGLGEKQVKQALYRKKAREKDPEYRPRDQTGQGAGFKYGEGHAEWEESSARGELRPVGGASWESASGETKQLTATLDHDPTRALKTTINPEHQRLQTELGKSATEASQVERPDPEGVNFGEEISRKEFKGMKTSQPAFPGSKDIFVDQDITMNNLQSTAVSEPLVSWHPYGGRHKLHPPIQRDKSWVQMKAMKRRAQTEWLARHPEIKV